MNEKLEKLTRHLFRDDPEIETLIRNGIESNRKGFADIRLFHADGTKVNKARLRFKLRKHRFVFGSNLYMLDEFPSNEQNAAYRQYFAELFNCAVIPIYWTGLEPSDGHLRFDRNSEKVFRRPPPDLAIEYCREHALTVKAHPLLWHEYLPAWLDTRDIGCLSDRIERHVREIAERYGKEINILDVVNEILTFDPVRFILPDNPLEFVFVLAEKYFPAGTRLMYNEVTAESWKNNGSYTPIDMVCGRLKTAGRRLGGLGLQYHLFFLDPDIMLEQKLDDTFFNPRYIYSTMNARAANGVPLHISEVTISGREELGGEEMQARIAERLYRLWFSHPACDGIFWWNLVEGTNDCAAALDSEQGENIHRSGLMKYDFTPKRAYRSLFRLLHEEWNTDCRMDYADGTVNKLHGFFGTYDCTVEWDGGIHTFSLEHFKDCRMEHTLVLSSEPARCHNY